MRKYIAIGIVLLFATMMLELSNAMFIKAEATNGLHESSRDQIELKYYDPNTLIYICGWVEPPGLWKEAIRLTQTELAPYRTWNLTQVVIGFGENPSQGPMNVRIYVYEKGNATHPGSIIVNDTTATLNGTSLITVPLVTPVSLADHDEIWVAVEWIQTDWMTHDYAFVDAGPAVKGKGDWIFFYNNLWQELQPALDSNWALGAVVEGQGLAPLEITNIKGPIGVKADIQNTGNVDALNVAWSIVVNGGILGRVNETGTGTDATLVAHGTLPISEPLFIGFGNINIVIRAQATNAVAVTETKSAFLLGPFVIRIK